MGPILPNKLAYLVSGWCTNQRPPGNESEGGSSGGSNRGGSRGVTGRFSGGGAGQSGAGADNVGPGYGTRVRVLYGAHLPVLYLLYDENFHTILEETVLPKVQAYILCKN